MDLLKFTYKNSDTKKINGYLKGESTDLLMTIREKIADNLFLEHKEPACELRFYWIDADADEIDIITQTDYLIFLDQSTNGRPHLLIASKGEKPSSESTPKIDVPQVDSSNEAIVHFSVECDSCLMAPIVGFRYKCIQCPNFDLCQNCESKHVHGDHMMVRMPHNNCPNVVDAWVTAGGSGRKLGRKHEKHSKCGDAGNVGGFGGCPFMPTASGTADADKSKEGEHGRHGRKRGGGRRHVRHSFLSNLYEMMNDLAEGGGAAAAAHAMGQSTSAEAAKDTTTNTTTTGTFQPMQPDPIHVIAKEAASAAMAAAQNAHDVSVKAADAAAKVAHQTALSAAFKPMPENDTATTSSSSTKEAEVTRETVTDKNASTSNVTTPVMMSASPSLQDLVHMLDPKLLKSGMEILNNFNDMFAKMLDPMDGAEGGDAAPGSCPFASDSRKNSTVSNQSNNSKKSNDSLNTSKTNDSLKSTEVANKEKSDENPTENIKKADNIANGLLVDVDDLGSDSESDSVSESFIKLNAPSKENTPEANKTSTPTTSQSSSSPPQSLNKSNVMDFAQLSANLKQHIAEEKKTADTVPEVAEAAVEMRAVPLFNTNSTSAVSPKTPEEKRAVPVYHADERINHSVHAMMAMGFSNEGAWLTQLLETVNGNIPQALDLISASQRR